jgi:hypothetical protein
MFKIIIYLIITITIIHFILYYFNFDFDFNIFDKKSNTSKSGSNELNILNELKQLNESINELKTLNECINNGEINTSFS